MTLNDDFSRRVLIQSETVDWVASPMPGVDRRMLDRIGDEVARATSIVRYAPKSQFPAHTHTGGEEFIVLDGVFQDEHGDFPTGTYVRNPPTSSHTPGSAEGCTIFVKLWQFDLDDRTRILATMGSDLADVAPGRRVQTLHADAREEVTYEEWSPGTEVLRDLPGGAELLILGGSLTEGDDALGRGAWLRLPEGARLAALTGPDGAKLWMKTGHLPHAAAPAT